MHTPVGFLKRSNPGHAFGTSEAGLTLLCCRLLRVLTAGIVERGFGFEICRGKIVYYVRWLTEFGSLIIRFVMVGIER